MLRLKIEQFMFDNPNDWEEKLKKSPYNLIADEDNDYVLFKYNQLESDFNQPLVKECRGIVIDKKTKDAVALSFEKFWNIQEPLHAEIDWKHAKVQEKVDGSKILVWYDVKNKQWRISTSGTLDAFTANVNGFGDTFGGLFCEALKNLNLSLEDFYSNLKTIYCYTFELVSPKSRIVVPYKKTKLYFIGLRDVTTFVELDPNEEKDISRLGIPRPKEYTLRTLHDCLKATDKMGFDQEGFVVVDNLWNRVKIKSPAYVAAHYLRNNGVTSYARVLTMIENNQDKKFLEIYPEYLDSFKLVEEKLTNIKSYIRESIEELQHDLQCVELNRKQLAQHIQKNYNKIAAFLFKFLDTDLIELFTDMEWNRLSLNKKLKYLDIKEEINENEFKEE